MAHAAQLHYVLQDRCRTDMTAVSVLTGEGEIVTIIVYTRFMGGVVD